MFQVSSQGSPHDILGRIAAGKPKKFFIPAQEVYTFFLEHGVETAAQEKAKGVGKVIKVMPVI